MIESKNIFPTGNGSSKLVGTSWDPGWLKFTKVIYLVGFEYVIRITMKVTLALLFAYTINCPN